MLYFDHNATTPVLPVALAAWLEATEKFIGNPSSPHRLGQRAEAAMQSAREQLAAFLGCDAMDIVWTSGATESNNMVFHHVARSFCLAERRAPARRGVAGRVGKERAESEFGAPGQSEVWVSAIEHPCVLAAADFHFPQRTRRIPVSRAGLVDLDWLRDGHTATFAPDLEPTLETGVVAMSNCVLALLKKK